MHLAIHRRAVAAFAAILIACLPATAQETTPEPAPTAQAAPEQAAPEPATDAPAAPEMTLEQVLAKHYEAMGGLDAIKAISAARFTGTMMVGPGAEAPFTMTFKKPLRARLDFTIQGMTGTQAYNSDSGWILLPFMGKTSPEPMPADEAKLWQEQADLDGPLVDWQEKGNQLALAGVEDVEGTQAYAIKVTLPNGEARTYYLDAEHFIVIKASSKTTIQDREVESDTVFSDYKEVGGVMFAHSIENRQKGAPEGQVITVKQVEIDPEVADDFFVMPAAAEEAAEEPGG